jgi:hypothetical protein
VNTKVAHSTLGEHDQEEDAEHDDARQAFARAQLDAQVLGENGERAPHLRRP